MVLKKFTAFSYINGRRLGQFNSLQRVFKKFPKERVAFNKVKSFNRSRKRRFTTTNQIRRFRRLMRFRR